MASSDGNKERERYYLLPGMGGSAARRKHRKFLLWSVVVGLIAAAILAALMYLINRIGSF